jgi:hypothetical protein
MVFKVRVVHLEQQEGLDLLVLRVKRVPKDKQVPQGRVGVLEPLGVLVQREILAQLDPLV